MNEHKYCVIDNNKTMRREHWIDGHLVAWVDVQLLMQEYIPTNWNLYYLVRDYGEWKAGNYTGDKDAML